MHRAYRYRAWAWEFATLAMWVVFGGLFGLLVVLFFAGS